MIRAICCDCGIEFERDPAQTWRIRCLPCWRRLKRAERAAGDPVVAELYCAIDARDEIIAALRAENAALRRRPAIPPRMAELLPRLVRLCHPDRHNGSRAATEATQALLALRSEVGR